MRSSVVEHVDMHLFADYVYEVLFRIRRSGLTKNMRGANDTQVLYSMRPEVTADHAYFDCGRKMAGSTWICACSKSRGLLIGRKYSDGIPFAVVPRSLDSWPRLSGVA
jgi:hypothetical protein